MRSEGRHRFVHLADALRLCVLWHHGGIYLDTDVVVLRSLSGLKNTVGEEYLGQGEHSISNAVMAFDAHHPFVWAAMADFARGFVKFRNESFPELIRSGAWGQNGPKLLQRVMRTYAQSKDGGASNLKTLSLAVR